MAKQEHLDRLNRGVVEWNRWREANMRHRPDLSNANLIEADLSRANLNEADLSGANVSRANLIEANLSGADLNKADLRGADLSGANLRKANLGAANLGAANLGKANLGKAYLGLASLSGADLDKADLTEADLSAAILNMADLSWADLSGARLAWTVFAGNDLSRTKGLELVQHLGPSSIGIDTIYKSNGKIPEVFLNGAGVPENFIAYARSLVDAPIQFYSCFISYSTQDQEFADRLHADLQARGVRCWFAPHDIRGGRKVHEQIDEAIRVYDKLLLILSEASMNSNWVKTEIGNARAREERQKRQMLFPVSIVPFERIRSWKLFDADTGIDSALEIREYFVPDFTNWKDHDSYQEAFNRLLRDLKAGVSDKASA